MQKRIQLSLAVLIITISVICLTAGCNQAPATSAADAAITTQTKQLYDSVDTKGLIRKHWVESAKDTSYGKDIVINGVKSTFHDGVVYRYPGLPPMLEVSGDYYEMGLQYGVLMRPEIYKSINAWGRVIEAEYISMGLNPVEDMKYMKEPAQDLADLLPQGLQDELKGIANGSGLPVESIITFSLMHDTGRLWAGTACAGVLLKGANGTIIHARNSDTSDGGSHEHANWIVIRHKTKGHNTVTDIGYPGSITIYHGCNDKGLTFALNNLTARKHNNSGFPSGFTPRILLEDCSSIAEAEKVLTTHLPINAYAATISDRHAGQGAVYEITPTAWAKRELTDNNPVWVFNNIIDPALYPQQAASKSIGFTSGWGNYNIDRWNVASTFKVKHEYTIDDGIAAMQMITGPDGSDYSWSGTRMGISNWMTDVFITHDPNGKGIYLGTGTSYASRRDIYYIDNDFSKKPTLYRKGIGVSQTAQDYADIRQQLPLSEERLKDYAALAAKYSNDPQAQFAAGWHAFFLKQSKGYAGYFEKAYSMKPDNVEYKLFAGLAALSSNNYDRVISILEDIKANDIYPFEELCRLTALQKAWKDRDQSKSDRYGEQIIAIVEKYQAQAIYKTRVLPIMNAFETQN